MLRTLLKLIVLIVVVVAAAGFLLGWWSARDVIPNSVGTSGRIGTERAREVGGKIADKTAAVGGQIANEAKVALADGTLTAKIKAKMALDDVVKARTLNVDTLHSVVTLSGTVRSGAERERALQLARETEGVRQVIDRVVIEVK